MSEPEDDRHAQFSIATDNRLSVREITDEVERTLLRAYPEPRPSSSSTRPPV